jgi:DNA invertase Pin-like site-specific DNA recombinase
MEKQCFSYIRVSTTRQGEHGVSLQEQQDAIQRYAQKNDIQISRSFEEQETAAKRGRPIFSAMIRLLRRGQACGVIIHKIDRGARNLKDWADLGELIDTGVEVHFANESLDLKTRGGRLSADIQAVVASDFIRNLREETKKGFYGRLKQGLYPLAAPVGYLDRGAGQPKEKDPAKAPLILQAFRLYATGNYSLPRLVDELYALGLRNRVGRRVTLNGISTILNNPFYMGLIRLRTTKELFPGVHQPIVTKELFDAVQNVLHGKTVPRRNRHDFVFRKLIRCERCGFNLIAEVQKGHSYYRCHTRDCETKTAREERIDAAVANVLAPLRMDEAELSYARQWITDARANQDARRTEELEAFRMRLTQVRDRLVRLTDAYIDGAIDKGMLDERRNGLLFEEAGLKQKIADLESGQDNTLDRLEKFLELAQTASDLYKMAVPEEKREFVKRLTSNLGVNRDLVAVELKSSALLIANRSIFPSGSPHRGIPRTWSLILNKLVAWFAKSPESQPQAMQID